MLCIVIAVLFINPGKRNDSLQEFVIILHCRIAPLVFSKGSPSRQDHILRMTEIRNIFCPQIRLYTKNMPGLLGIELSRNRIIHIDVLDRSITADCQRFFRHVLSLIEIEIQTRLRSHNHVMPCLGSLDTTFFAPP